MLTRGIWPIQNCRLNLQSVLNVLEHKTGTLTPVNHVLTLDTNLLRWVDNIDPKNLIAHCDLYASCKYTLSCAKPVMRLNVQIHFRHCHHTGQGAVQHLLLIKLETPADGETSSSYIASNYSQQKISNRTYGDVQAHVYR